MCSLSESRIELVAYLNLRLEFKKISPSKEIIFTNFEKYHFIFI